MDKDTFIDDPELIRKCPFRKIIIKTLSTEEEKFLDCYKECMAYGIDACHVSGTPGSLELKEIPFCKLIKQEEKITSKPFPIGKL